MRFPTLASMAALAMLLGKGDAFSTTSKISTRIGTSNIVMPPDNSIRTTTRQFQPLVSPSKSAIFSVTNAQSGQQPEVDVDALVKYAVSGIVQMGSFYALLSAMDLGLSNFNMETLPFWANCLFFYACSLKSRVLNPLNNQRPKVDSVQGGELVRPSWTPPGVFFPIMWLLIIGPIRAYSSSLVIDATGEYANIATLSFLLHLSIGDVWNTINNVEKRLGAAASGVVLVVLSAANAAYQYYQVDPNAGELLGLTLLWLTTAGVLVNSIWRLNPDSATGEVDSLLPVKGSVETEFAWFGKSAD